MTYIQPSFSEVVGQYASPYLGAVLVISVSLAIGFISLFILHSTTIWLSTDPETAFHAARDYAGYVSTGWNSARTLYNGAKKIAFYWVPSWNTFSKHMIEPGVNIGIDVITQVFAGHHFQGIVTDNSITGVPFRGHYCGDPIRNELTGEVQFGAKTPTTTKYCSFQSEALWAGELGIAESSDGVSAISNNTLILSTAHARKLQEYFTEDNGEGESMFPALNLGPLLEAITEISGIISMVQTTLYDIAAHVIYTVLSELAKILFNVVQIVIRAIASVVMSLVASGALQTIIRSGLDLLMILVVHVALPLLFSILDLIVCLINFIQPGTWPDQLRCVESTCFLESGDIGTQLALELICLVTPKPRILHLWTYYVFTILPHALPFFAGGEIFTTFSSLPVIARAIATAAEALINPSTGRKFGEAAEGGTEIPDMGNDAHATAAAATCASCFTCKVPEVRALWLLVAMTCTPRSLTTPALHLCVPTTNPLYNAVMSQMAVSKTSRRLVRTWRTAVLRVASGTSRRVVHATASPSS